MKTEEQIAAEEVWLVHKDGFSLGESGEAHGAGAWASLVSGLGGWWASGSGQGWMVCRERLVAQPGEGRTMKGPERTATASQAHVCLSVCPCSAATQLKSKELSLPEGKLRVKLDHDGAVLDVDEDDVEKVRRRLEEGTRGGPCWAGQAVCWRGRPDLLLLRCPPVCPIPQANAPSCDRLEDLASLVYLNESSVLHTLRQRYGASLLHTYAGPSLLVLSPRGAPAVYSEKVRPTDPPPSTSPPCPPSPALPLSLGIPQGSCPHSKQ